MRESGAFLHVPAGIDIAEYAYLQAVDMVSERLKKGAQLTQILSDLFDACLSPHPSANEVCVGDLNPTRRS